MSDEEKLKQLKIDKDRLEGLIHGPDKKPGHQHWAPRDADNLAAVIKEIKEIEERLKKQPK